MILLLTNFGKKIVVTTARLKMIIKFETCLNVVKLSVNGQVLAIFLRFKTFCVCEMDFQMLQNECLSVPRSGHPPKHMREIDGQFSAILQRIQEFYTPCRVICSHNERSINSYSIISHTVISLYLMKSEVTFFAEREVLENVNKLNNQYRLSLFGSLFGLKK